MISHIIIAGQESQQKIEYSCFIPQLTYEAAVRYSFVISFRHICGRCSSHEFHSVTNTRAPMNYQKIDDLCVFYIYIYSAWELGFISSL